MNPDPTPTPEEIAAAEAIDEVVAFYVREKIADPKNRFGSVAAIIARHNASLHAEVEKANASVQWALRERDHQKQMKDEIQAILDDKTREYANGIDRCLAENEAFKKERDRLQSLIDADPHALVSVTNRAVLIANAATEELTVLKKERDRLQQENDDHAESWAMCGIPHDSLLTKMLVLQHENQTLRKQVKAAEGLRNALDAIHDSCVSNKKFEGVLDRAIRERASAALNLWRESKGGREE